VLRGAGATLFLPFLPSALPRSTWAAAPAPAPIRLAVCVVPNGIYGPEWQPPSTGAGYELLAVTQPLAALQSRFSILSGTQNESLRETVANHGQAMGSLLTDDPIETVGGAPDNGVSVDQVAADAFGALTPFRSMQLGVDNGPPVGTVYFDTVSWGAADTPYPPIVDPRTAFSRMFGLEEGLSTDEITASKIVRKSILDRVIDRTGALRTRLSATDAQKLDQYETAVRELELQIQRLEGIACEAPPEPMVNPGFAEATDIMYDLMHQAFACDLTRSITFLQGPTVSLYTYAHLGLTTDDHTLSHDAWTDLDARADRILMEAWQVERFAAFMQKLADTTDMDGNDLLSNTICVYTSELGHGNEHVAYGTWGVPIGIGGGENAGIVQGQHRALGPQPHANVWLGLLHLLGIEEPTFGKY
jgi:hypothetical protein